MQSEINLQQEKLVERVQKELELRKEIDALTREGGRGSVLRQRKVNNDTNTNEIDILEKKLR